MKLVSGTYRVRDITESAGINIKLDSDLTVLSDIDYESMNSRRFFVSAAPPVVLVVDPRSPRPSVFRLVRRRLAYAGLDLVGRLQSSSGPD